MTVKLTSGKATAVTDDLAFIVRNAIAYIKVLEAELARCKQVCAATAEAWREEAALGCDHCNSPLYVATRCRVCGRETPIIEPEIKGDNKPVAWMHTDPDNPRVKFLEWGENEPGYRGDWIKTPLFTAPTQRAHGIGGNDVGT